MNYLDKYSKRIQIGDNICIENCSIPYQVKTYTSTGIDVGKIGSIEIEVLKKNHQSVSNTGGFIPLYCLDPEKIKICSPEEYPECFI